MKDFLRLQIAILVLLAGATGCGAPSSDEYSPPDLFEGTVRDDLTAGQPVTIDEWSGILRFGVTRKDGTFLTKCTGVLWTNNTALTTVGCANMASEVRSGSQSASLSKGVPQGEVMMLRLSRSFKVWNSTRTSAPTTGYVRPINNGPDADFAGTQARIVTIPPGVGLGATTQTGNVHLDLAEYADFNITANGTSIITKDDAGSPCFDGGPMTDYANARLNGLADGCRPDFDAQVCRATGAEQWFAPLALILLNGW